MADTLRNADIVKGSAMEIWLTSQQDATGVCVAFATDHSVSINVETTEISTKSHGDFAAQLPTRITWSASASNLYCEDGAEVYLKKTLGMSPVGIKFAAAENYLPYGATGGAEPGIVVPVYRTDAPHEDWYYDDSKIIAQGDAIITQLDINAPAGDNATLSIQLQGVGTLTSPIAGVTGLPSQGDGK